MAPAANIVDVRVLDANGNGRLSSVIRGVEWALAHRAQYNIRVINLSLGAPPAPTYRADLLAGAVEMAWKRGIVVVVASGNDGPGGGTVQSPGMDPFAITVGATDDQGTVSLPMTSWRGSRRGARPLVGSRSRIWWRPAAGSSRFGVPGSTLDGLFADHRVTASGGSSYFRLRGTSIATGVAAGAAALMLPRQPSLTPDQVKERLTATAQDYGPNGAPPLPNPLADGAGLLDARAAAWSGGRRRQRRRVRRRRLRALGLLRALRAAAGLARPDHLRHRLAVADLGDADLGRGGVGQSGLGGGRVGRRGLGRRSLGRRGLGRRGLGRRGLGRRGLGQHCRGLRVNCSRFVSNGQAPFEVWRHTMDLLDSLLENPQQQQARAHNTRVEGFDQSVETTD